MSYGPATIFTTTVLSGATASSAIDLGRAWDNVYVAIQSMTSNSQLHLQAAISLTGTYRRVKHPTINSVTVATNDFTIPSSVTNSIVPLPAGLRFIKIEQTATADSSQAYTIIVGGT